MRWMPKGYGGGRRTPDQVKRAGWVEYGILVVNENDHRLTSPERQVIRQLGEKLFGKREPKDVRHG
jgi:hypothetical protein